MPKQSRYEGTKVVGRKTSKLRIGNRKNGRPASEMSNEELRQQLGGRYHSNALKVLMSRNAPLTEPVVEETETETPETA